MPSDINELIADHLGRVHGFSVVVTLSEVSAALRQERAAEGLAEALRELLVPVKFAGETMWGPAGHRFPGYEATVPSASVKIAEAALSAYEEAKK